MIDIEIIRQDPKRIRKELKKRFIKDIDLDAIIAQDKKRREKITELENLRAEQRKLSKEIGKNPDKRAALLAQAKKSADKIKQLEPGLAEEEKKFFALTERLPNFIHESVPIGPSAKENTIAAMSGEKPEFDFPVKPHWQIAEAWGALDIARAARVSGSRFAYLKGDLVLLNFALLRFALDEALQAGFTPMLTPTLVKQEAIFGSGADMAEVYALPKDDLYLIGTSEITLLNYHAHETIDVAEQPLRYTGFTTNYRREAGTYSKDIRGMLRLHQFDKLELFTFASQEQSWDFFEQQLVPLSERILQKLGLHYRKVVLSSGDLPRKFQKTYDLEVWMPSEKAYREVASLSHAGDFQSRRLGIKYRSKEGERRYAHTLNATAITFSRLPAVILENFQQADGRVAIPEVLQPLLYNRAYLGEKSAN